MRVDKGEGEEGSAPIVEVIAAASGFQVAAGDVVYGLPPGPFPQEVSFLIFRDDAGRLQFGFRSCGGDSPAALPETGGPPSGFPEY